VRVALQLAVTGEDEFMELDSMVFAFVRIFRRNFCIQLQGGQIRIPFNQSVQRHVPEERNLQALTS
jgi:hypothetical protein